MSPPPYTNIANPRRRCNKSKKKVGGQETLCKFDLLNPKKAKDPREIGNIHNLTQYLPTSTFENSSRGCGAYTKSHGSFLFINIGLLHPK